MESAEGGARMLRRVCWLSVMIFAPSVTASPAISGAFIENRGQINDQVHYYTLGSPMAAYFTSEAVVIIMKEPQVAKENDVGPWQTPNRLADRQERASRRTHAVWIRFNGANPSPAVEAWNAVTTYHNFFLGSDPDKWRTHVPAYREVVYRDLWPGVDLAFWMDGTGIAYEARFDAGGSVTRIDFSYDGAITVTDLEDGSLLIETTVGAFVDTGPMSGRRRGAFRLESLASVSDHGRDDPSNPEIMAWSRLLGTDDWDWPEDAEIAPDGSPIMVGSFVGFEFPDVDPADEHHYPGIGGRMNIDCYLAKLTPDSGIPIWVAYIGGPYDEYGYGLALHPSGDIIIAGSTEGNLPANNSHNGGQWDAYFASLSANGAALNYCMYFGGSENDDGMCVEISPVNDNLVLLGRTGSSDIPHEAEIGVVDFNPSLFVALLDHQNGQYVEGGGLLLGGTHNEEPYDMTLHEENGNLTSIIVGYTDSDDFPTTDGAHDRTLDGENDAFVTKLAWASGWTLGWSTYLGGSSTDGAYGITSDSIESILVVGTTGSSDFPASQQVGPGGSSDGFVCRFNQGGAKSWGTRIGGSNSDGTGDIAVAADGNLMVTLGTQSNDFPVSQWAFDKTYNEGSDVLIVRLDADGSEASWSTYLGGMYDDAAARGLLDAEDDLYVIGFTYSPDFPTTAGLEHQGLTDIFSTKLYTHPAACCRMDDCNTWIQPECLENGGHWFRDEPECRSVNCSDPIEPYTLCDVSWDRSDGNNYGVARLLGKDVNPKGIAGIAISPSSTDREFQITQGRCCVTVKHRGPNENGFPGDPEVKIGNRVKTYGTVSMDHGMNQISRPDFGIIVHSDIHELPPIPTISTIDHASHGLDYEYESCLIRMEGVRVVRGEWPQVDKDGDLAITNGGNADTTTLRIFKESGINVNTAPPIDQPFSVIGISGQRDEDGPPYDSGYDIRPRVCEDIQPPTNCPPPPAQPDVSGVEEPPRFESLYLSPSFPNPSRGLTRIRYAIPSGSEEVRLRVYDPAGRLLRTLVRETKTAGVYDVAWDGRNDVGAFVAGGVYFFELRWNGRSETHQAIMLR